MFRSLAISLALTLFLLGFGTGLAVAPSAVEQGDLIQFGGTIPPVRLDTASLMRLFNAPGFSVAVIEDWKIAWAKGYGVTEMGGLVPVTPRTLFLAGSISKPVAAVGSMTLVQNGTLNLDEDVNDKLTTWRVPENQFTAKNKVTLRRILSHTAGMTVHGFDGYSRGSVTPTLTQILDGTPPATNDPVRVDVEPGTI